MLTMFLGSAEQQKCPRDLNLRFVFARVPCLRQHIQTHSLPQVQSMILTHLDPRSRAES